MTDKKKIAGKSYLRPIIGGPNQGQPAREKWFRDQKRDKKLGPPPVNEIA